MSLDIGSVFKAHIAHQFTNIDRLVDEGVLPARRELVFDADDALYAFNEMLRIVTFLEDNPVSMRFVSLPLFFEQSDEFNVEEYLRVVCRILELTMPNSLNLTCAWCVPEIKLEAALDTVRRILCPALQSLDSLVHIGVEEISQALSLPSSFMDLADEVFLSTPGCHSLRLDWSCDLPNSSTGAKVRGVLLKRYMAHTNDARFHQITRIQCPPVSDFYSDELKLFRLLRVSDFEIPLHNSAPFSPRDFSEYVSVFLPAMGNARILAEALSMPDSLIRGLNVSDFDHRELADAIGSSPLLEEISVNMSVLKPKSLVAFADGVSRSQQLQRVSIHCDDGCDVEGALVKILACASLRVLDMKVNKFTDLSKEVSALIRSHESLEYCFVGQWLPSSARFEFVCHDNVVKSMRVLMFLLLQWVGSFTELPAVDINLFRLIRTWMIMPTE